MTYFVVFAEHIFLAQTTLVGTLSPADYSLAESLSTLKFCQRAKAIKNNAIINEETAGSIEALQNEILALRQKLSQYSSQGDKATLTPSKIRSPGRFVITSPAKNSTSSKKDYCTSEAERLLTQSLLRTRTTDEMSLRNEVAIRDLNKQLAQAENFSMGMKMKVKMRDSEIQRLKKKEGAGSEHTLDDIVKVEVDAVKHELQSEVVRYKLTCEELQRRLSLYEPCCEVSQKEASEKAPKKEVFSPFSLWNSSNEEIFQHEMSDYLTEVEAKNDEFQKYVDDFGKGMFLAYFGITVDDAQSLRKENAELKSKFEKSHIKCEATEMALSNALSKASNLEATVLTLRRELESSKSMFECEMLEQSATISCLKNEIADKSDTISVLQGDIKRTDEELLRAQQVNEKEMRDQHNKLMKDNMILVQKARDQTHMLEEKSNIQVSLEEKVSYVCKQMEAAGIKHNDAVEALQSRLSEADQVILTQINLLKESDERVVELEEANLSWNVEATKLAEQLEATTAELLQTKQELESSMETTDNLHSQAETLIANLEEEKTLRNNSDAKVCPVYLYIL